MPIGNTFPIFSRLRTTPQILIQIKVDTKEKADFCNWQFQSAFTREAEYDPPSKGTSTFPSKGEITADRKGSLNCLMDLMCIKHLAQMDSMPECSRV